MWTHTHTHTHTFTSVCCGIRIQTVKLLWQEADISRLPWVCLPKVLLHGVWSSCPWLWTCRRRTQVNHQVFEALALRLCRLISVAVRIKRCAAWDCGFELMLCESVWRCVWLPWWGVCVCETMCAPLCGASQIENNIFFQLNVNLIWVISQHLYSPLWTNDSYELILFNESNLAAQFMNKCFNW